MQHFSASYGSKSDFPSNFSTDFHLFSIIQVHHYFRNQFFFFSRYNPSFMANSFFRLRIYLFRLFTFPPYIYKETYDKIIFSLHGVETDVSEKFWFSSQIIFALHRKKIKNLFFSADNVKTKQRYWSSHCWSRTKTV